MRKLSAFAFGLMSLASSLWGVADPQCPSLSGNVGAGWRQGNMRWTIGAPGGSPNFFVTNDWKELRMYGLGGSLRYVGVHHYVIQLDANCGKIYHGHNRESIYFGDDKTSEATRIRSDADQGHVYDLSAAIGYQVMSTGRRTLVTILAGYSHDQQNLRLLDGTVVRSGIGQPLGPIPFRNSTYNARWFGPWLGIDLSTRVECNGSAYISFAWHLPQFRAGGNWKLRDNLMDNIQQKASGWGYDAMLGFSWDFSECWGVGISGKYRLFHTHTGSNRGTMLLGPAVVPVHSKLNSVHWDVVSAFFTLYGRF